MADPWLPCSIHRTPKVLVNVLQQDWNDGHYVSLDFNIEYIKTDDFGQADALSRLINETGQDAFDEEIEPVIASIQTVDQDIIDITKEALGSSKARRTLRNKINSGRVLSKLKTCIQRNTFNKSDEDLTWLMTSFYSVTE